MPLENSFPKVRLSINPFLAKGDGHTRKLDELSVFMQK